MENYIDLVICESFNGKREFFQAPAFSHLENGEMVIVECAAGEGLTNVVASHSLRLTDKEEVDFIKAALNIPEYESLDEIDRIKGRYIFRKLDFEEA